LSLPYISVLLFSCGGHYTLASEEKRQMGHASAWVQGSMCCESGSRFLWVWRRPPGGDPWDPFTLVPPGTSPWEGAFQHVGVVSILI